MTTFKKTKVGMKTSDLEGTAGYTVSEQLREHKGQHIACNDATWHHRIYRPRSTK
jgi:hypothetical protein